MAFVIYDRQIAVFQPVMVERFLRKLVATVREHYAKEVAGLGDAELYLRVKEDYEIAIHYGVTTERGLVRFICMGFGLGRKFHLESQFQQLFEMSWVNKDECIDMIYDNINRMEAGLELRLTISNYRWKEYLLREICNNEMLPANGSIVEFIRLICRISENVYN